MFIKTTKISFTNYIVLLESLVYTWYIYNGMVFSVEGAWVYISVSKKNYIDCF